VTPVLGNILQPLIDFFHWFLERFHDDLGLSWGWSIIALTLLVRAVLLPVTYKSSKSMIRLQQLAPQMKSMQKKYKEDPQRLQQETMKFYRENSVNPFASCLPMIAQLPVFLSLYYMLRVDLRYDICPQINNPETIGQVATKPCGETPESSFLFIPDLTDKATGAVLVVLIILYVGSQLVSTLLMSATADKNQRMIFLALPFLFVAFIWQFPAGLLVYWITTNLWTILQQSIIKKRLGPLREEAAAAAKAHKEKEELEEANAKGKGKKGGKSGDGKSGGGGRALGKLSPTPATADGGGAVKSRGANGPPPAPPRKKKKRSGRRR
jgi:YidC/Oxa1 family membrane protein insertase